MRGADERPVRCSVTCRSRSACRGPSFRAIRRITDRRSSGSRRVRHPVCEFRAAVDPAGEAVARVAAAGAVHDSQRAAADRADRLQPAVSVVRRPGDGRRGVVADDVYQESRPAAGRRHRRGLLRRGVDPRRHGAAAVGRALHGRRDAVGGVGQPEEFPPARSDPPANGGGNPTVNFHGERRTNATHQSTTDPTRGSTRKRRPGAARVLGPCADGASVGLDRERDGHAGRRLRRTRCGGRDGRPARRPAHHGRRRQRLRQRDLVAGLRRMRATPHVAQNADRHRGSAIDARTTRHPATPSVSRNGSSSNKASAG